MIVVLFDGLCNFCNSTVNWIIDHDRANKFKFAALQSEYGLQIVKQFNLNHDYLDTVILLEDGKVYLRSEAILRILKHIGGVYGLAYVFSILPYPLMNFFYNIVAKYRYAWFGKREACRVPDAAVKAKFIE